MRRWLGRRWRRLVETSRQHSSSSSLTTTTMTHDPSTTIHSILLVQSTCLTVPLHNLSPGPLWSSSWSGTLYRMTRSCCNRCQLTNKSALSFQAGHTHTHTPCISSPNHHHFTTHAHSIAACSAVVAAALNRNLCRQALLVVFINCYNSRCHDLSVSCAVLAIR